MAAAGCSSSKANRESARPTLLGRSVTRRAPETSTVVWGRCWEEGGAPAYWPWTQVLRSVLRQRPPTDLSEGDVVRLRRLVPIVPEVAALIPGGDPGIDDAPPVQFALFDAVTTLLHDSVAVQPFVVVLDDLHAADHDSLRLLHFFARELPHGRLLVVGTYRGDDAARTGADLILTKLAREGRVLPLRGLTESQVGMLVEQIAGEPAGSDVVRTVHRATNGNPLYIDSITHLLVAEERLNAAAADADEPDGAAALPLPPSIRDATRSRLSYLDDEARSLLRVAAVIGRTFTLPVLGMVVGREQDPLLDLPRGRCQPADDPRERPRPWCVRVRAHPRPRRAVSRARTEPAGRAALASRHRTRTRASRRPRSVPRRARPPLPAGDRPGT